MKTYRKTTKNRVMGLLKRNEAPLSKRSHVGGLIKSQRGFQSTFAGKTRYRPSLSPVHKRGRVILKSDLNIVCAIYLLLITCAELLTAYKPKLGIVVHITLMFGLLLYAALESDRNKYFSQFLMALIIAPLIRILSLSMPIVHFSRIFWFILISIPIFIAVFTCMWLQRIHPKDVGLTMPALKDVPIELGVILIAIPFGIMEYQILKPSPLDVWPEIPFFIVVALIMIVYTGFLEELAFRGLIQFTTLRVMSKWWGILFVSIIFGVLHLGNLTVLDCLLAFTVGFLFSVVREKTGSLYGITISHGVINFILFIVAPLYF